ncbi:zinc-dependent alcohol dehydrogenase [Agromyces binzhouensis]|uniref:zinc-dependent alcohol dehydrogenase n=1 Tax=Agromyces binzhouensis TaxID=1817495 RepID=UPI00362BA7E2
MRALVFTGAGDATVATLPVPEPGPGEVLVRVSVCGVCGSDAAEYDHGPVLTSPPVVLGHEFAGTVERIGPDVEGLAVGATVVCGAGVSCGTCRACLRGRTNLCERYRTAGLQSDGGLAEFAVVPGSVLLDVSGTGLSPDTLALAQPMSIAVHAVRRSGLGPSDHAVIVGTGGIGAFLVVAAAAVGQRVLAVDLDPERLALARRLGAHEVLDAHGGSVADRLQQLGMSPDVLFEVSGSAAGLRSVLDAARPGSTIVPVGIQRADVTVPLAQWTVREYTVIGTNAHVFADDLPEAVRLLAARDDWSDVAPLALPLEHAVSEGLEPLRAGTSTRIKTLIDPRAEAPRPADHRRN